MCLKDCPSFQASLRSKEEVFLWDLFERVCKDTSGGSHLILLNSPEVGKFLNDKMAQKGPLSILDTMGEETARYTLLLAKHHSHQGRYADSARLYRLLAERRCTEEQQTVTLDERIALLTQAQNQVCMLQHSEIELII